MYVHHITLHTEKALTSAAHDMLELFLTTLRMNGQLCGREWSIVSTNGQLTTTVMALERYSLARKFDSKYTTSLLARAKTAGMTISSQLVGKDFHTSNACSCKQRSGYVLFTTYLSLESPVRCLDCFQSVPLYRLPCLPSDEHYETIAWQSNYQNCDSLQMNCQVLERSATRELEHVQSALSTDGRALCSMYSQRLNAPVYYYLYRGRASNVAAEQRRGCPLCHSAWLLDKPMHSIFHFKCDQCHLVSNLAWSLR